MVVASTLRIQAPENVRNKWSLAMRTFSNSRCNCEVQSSLDFSTTETGCLMSNASSKDIADLGIVVMKDSIVDVKKNVDTSQGQEYTLSFKDSDDMFFEARLTDEDVDNSFLSSPKFLVQSIFFTASNNSWPTESNQGLRSMLHAFMNNDVHGTVDHLLAIPSKNFTTSLPLQAVDRSQTFKATCNAYELRDNNQQVLQEYAHTQCKFQELHSDGMNVGHVIMEMLSLKEKRTGYTATVQLTVNNEKTTDKEAAVDTQENTEISENQSVHVIHADAHFTLQMRCSHNKGSRKLHLPAYAAMHELQASQSTHFDYKNLMRTSNLQNLHLGFGIPSLVLRSSSTPIVFLMVPSCKSPKFESCDYKKALGMEDAPNETHEMATMSSDESDSDKREDARQDSDQIDSDQSDSDQSDSDPNGRDNSALQQEFNDSYHDENKSMPIVMENPREQATFDMREPQVCADEAFYASYTEVVQQDPIMRQALFRRSNREV
jgi:hypothetical protein